MSVSEVLPEVFVCVFGVQQDWLDFSGELHLDLNVGSLGNWLRSYGIVFGVGGNGGMISVNVFNRLRRTVINFCI